MSVLVKAKFVGGKISYYSSTEQQKKQIELLKQFAKDNEGLDIWKEFHSADEMNFEKNLINYYNRILLPAMYTAMKDDFGLTHKGECNAALCLSFLKKQGKKKDGTEFSLIMRIEDVSFQDQAEFVSAVANLAITKYNLRFPSAIEIQKSNLV